MEFGLAYVNTEKRKGNGWGSVSTQNTLRKAEWLGSRIFVGGGSENVHLRTWESAEGGGGGGEYLLAPNMEKAIDYGYGIKPRST